MTNILDKKKIAYIAVFGGLWGLLEISFGAVMHALHLPFKGIWLTGAAVIVILTAYSIVPARGVPFSMGVVVIVLKMFSIGGFIFSPFIAVIFEAAIAEIILFGRKPSRKLFILTGCGLMIYTFSHRIIWGLLIYGRSTIDIYEGIIKQGVTWLGLPEEWGMLVIVILFLFHLVSGIIAGWAAWMLSNKAKNRLNI